LRHESVIKDVYSEIYRVIDIHSSLRSRCFRQVVALDERRLLISELLGPAQVLAHMRSRRAVRLFYRFCRAWVFSRRHLKQGGFVWNGKTNRYFWTTSFRYMYQRVMLQNNAVVLHVRTSSRHHHHVFVQLVHLILLFFLQLMTLPLLLFEVFVARVTRGLDMLNNVDGFIRLIGVYWFRGIR
jgi:hypothetical protein